MSSIRTYKFDVKMYCSGCSTSIGNVLKKAQAAGEITEFDVSLEKEEVIVKSSNLGYEEVKGKIAKTGKEIRSGITVE